MRGGLHYVKEVIYVKIRLLKMEDGTFTLVLTATRRGEGRPSVQSGLAEGAVKNAIEVALPKIQAQKQERLPTE